MGVYCIVPLHPLPTAPPAQVPRPSQAPHAHTSLAICEFGAGTLPGSGWSCHTTLFFLELISPFVPSCLVSTLLWFSR